MKTVFITGVSSGLGLGMAKAFCKRNYRVVGTVRNATDGQRVSTECGPSFIPLLMDVQDLEAIERLPERLEAAGVVGRLDGLINNAGILSSGPVLNQSVGDVSRMFEVNVIGLIAVTKALLPLMGADGQAGAGISAPGRIINISSVGGKVATPFIAGYNATKFAVEGFSHALRRELLPFGIDVIIVGPGAVRSEIWAHAKPLQRSLNLHDPYREPMRLFEEMVSRIQTSGFTKEEAGELVVKIFEVSRPRTRYALVRGRIINWILPLLLPDRWLDFGVGRALGLR